jgi:hypothetical protein
MAREISRRRMLIEWSLSAAALTLIAAVMLSMDTPVRQYTGAMMTEPGTGGHLRVPLVISGAARTAWQICMDHQQLAGFSGVALVLVLFMRRMR